MWKQDELEDEPGRRKLDVTGEVISSSADKSLAFA